MLEESSAEPVKTSHNLVVLMGSSEARLPPPPPDLIMTVAIKIHCIVSELDTASQCHSHCGRQVSFSGRIETGVRTAEVVPDARLTPAIRDAVREFRAHTDLHDR